MEAPKHQQIFRVGTDYGYHVSTDGDEYVLRYLARDKRKGTFRAKIADCDGDPANFSPEMWRLL